jgi:hypothetical protein
MVTATAKVVRCRWKFHSGLMITQKVAVAEERRAAKAHQHICLNWPDHGIGRRTREG